MTFLEGRRVRDLVRGDYGTIVDTEGRYSVIQWDDPGVRYQGRVDLTKPSLLFELQPESASVSSKKETQ